MTMTITTDSLDEPSITLEFPDDESYQKYKHKLWLLHMETYGEIRPKDAKFGNNGRTGLAARIQRIGDVELPMTSMERQYQKYLKEGHGQNSKSTD